MVMIVDAFKVILFNLSGAEVVVKRQLHDEALALVVIMTMLVNVMPIM